MTNTRSKDTILLPNLLNSALGAIHDLDSMLANLTRELQQSVVVDGKVSHAKLEEGQYEVHSFSWVATYVEAL
ncbi:MAG: acyl-CoA dehydrogenase, partial [Paracoccaceae bacterium]|nr:acyl-CoA dehydrogenase [Paracoccaceae bacterium]